MNDAGQEIPLSETREIAESLNIEDVELFSF